ncbi:MAG: response regulator, partial [candidate division Zixibacteria bacterium]|nr:response regulator [candidate division Zixibacteria bacterium]
MNQKTVLLIDDDPDILHMYTLKFSLEETVSLVTASTPEKGLALAKRLTPDLILLDLILPKTSGLPQFLDKRVGF